MEAYKIWASLNIKGDAIEKMKIFQESIRAANYDLSLLTVNLDKLSRTLSLANPNFSKLEQSISVINKEGLESVDIFSKYDSALMKSAASTELLSNKTRVLNQRLKESSVSSSVAYKSHIMGLNGQELDGISSAKVARSSGIGMAVPGMIAAYTGYEAISHSFKATGDYEKSVLQLAASGASPSQVEEARKISIENAPKGVSSIEMMKVLNTAFMASRDWKEAKVLAPMLAQTEFGLKSTYGNKMSEYQLQNLQKFAEFRAGSDLSKLQSGIDLGAKIVSAGGFTIEPTQLAQFMRRSSFMAGSITAEGFAQMEPTLQELTPTAVGTGLQTQWKNMMQGIVSNRNQGKLLEKLGFAHTTYDPHGRPLTTEWDKKLLSLFKTSPVDFIKETNIRLSKNGIPESQYGDFYAKMFSNTFGRVAVGFEKNMGKSDKELSLFNSQLTGTQLYNKSLNIPSGVSERFESASSRLAVAFGKLTGPSVISAMNLISSFMEKLASVFNLFSGGSRLNSFTEKSREVLSDKNIINSIKHLFSGENGISNNVSVISNNKRSNDKLVADVNLDGRKVGNAIFSYLPSSMMGGSIGSTSGFNSAHSPAPSALTNMGTP